MKFDQAVVAGWLERILGHEGGLSMWPDDPGNWTSGKVGEGERKGTKWGIAANTYPHLDIKNLTKEQAADIYIKDYLAKLEPESMQDGVVFQLLDFAINSGVDRAVVCLQRAVGAVEDGRMGPATVAAVKRYTEAEVVMRLLAARLEFMAGLSVWPTFGRGWCRRIAANLRYGGEDLP